MKHKISDWAKAQPFSGMEFMKFLCILIFSGMCLTVFGQVSAGTSVAFASNLKINISIYANNKKIPEKELEVKIEGLNVNWETDSTEIIKGKFEKGDSSYNFGVDTHILNSKCKLVVIYDSIVFDYNMNGVLSSKDSLKLRKIHFDILSIDAGCFKQNFFGGVWLYKYSVSTEDFYEKYSTDPIMVVIGMNTCSPLTYTRLKRGISKKW